MALTAAILFLCFLASPVTTYGVANISDSGLPLVSELANVALIEFDIFSRTEVRNLSATAPLCTADPEFYSWCGGTPNLPYSYCISADYWPPENVHQWLLRSYFTPTEYGEAYYKFPVYSSFCVCPNPGRAFFVPEPIPSYPTYSRQCPSEIGLLAVLVFLIFCFLLISLFLIFDILLWLVLFCASNRQFQFWGAFTPKVLILLAALLTIISICLLLTTRSYLLTPRIYFGQIWAWAASIIFALLSYLFWITIFFDMVSTVTKMTPTSKRTLGAVRWVVVVIVLVPVTAVFICSIILYAFGQILVTDEHTALELAAWNSKVLVVEKAMATFSLVAMFFCLLWGTGLTLKTLHWILADGHARRSHIEKEIFIYKTLYTIGATVSLWLTWGALLAFTILAAWSAALDLTPYEYALAPLWIEFGQGIFVIFELLFLTLATKTHLQEKTYCELLASSISDQSSQGSKGFNNSKGA